MLTAAAAAPAVAHAATPRPLGTSAALLQADGTRFAAYKSSATKLTVRDDARARRFRITLAPECAPVDMARGGFLLIACERRETPGPRLEVFDLTDRTRHPVPESPDPDRPFGYDATFEHYPELGRHWLRGTNSAGGHFVIVFLNWRTGEKRTFFEEQGEGYTPRNLDSPGLEAIAPERPGGAWSFERDAPYSVAHTGLDARGAPRDLMLFRGGTADSLGRRITILERCAKWCSSVSIGGGLVTWSYGRAAKGYAVRGGRRFGWRFAQTLVPFGERRQVVQHTRTTVYVSLFDADRRQFELTAVRWR